MRTVELVAGFRPVSIRPRIPAAMTWVEPLRLDCAQAPLDCATLETLHGE
jgi:hypothetical protein